MNDLRRELDEILSNSTGERDLLAFIARNPKILRGAICKVFGHSAYVVKEFPFGAHYRADFVIATSYSGAWEVHLIELEPHDDHVITKGGLPSGKLNKALSQVADWKEYIEKNQYLFRSDLSDWCKKKDLLKIYDTISDPSNYSGQLLRSMDTTIWIYYHIIIGKERIYCLNNVVA